MKRVKKHIKKLKEHKYINNLLTLVVVILGFYIIFAPLIPQAKWVVVEETPLKEVFSKSDDVLLAADGQIGSNRLFIPKLGLSEVIYEGGSEQLSKGVLRRSQTSTPDIGSNTVLVGHRFTYSQKGVFYHLDKLNVGDMISVHWEIDKFDYQVTEILTVSPESVYIEDPTENNILTIYTCTPLWTAKERLVVRAKLL